MEIFLISLVNDTSMTIQKKYERGKKTPLFCSFHNKQTIFLMDSIYAYHLVIILKRLHGEFNSLGNSEDMNLNI